MNKRLCWNLKVIDITLFVRFFFNTKYKKCLNCIFIISIECIVITIYSLEFYTNIAYVSHNLLFVFFSHKKMYLI